VQQSTRVHARVQHNRSHRITTYIHTLQTYIHYIHYTLGSAWLAPTTAVRRGFTVDRCADGRGVAGFRRYTSALRPFRMPLLAAGVQRPLAVRTNQPHRMCASLTPSRERFERRVMNCACARVCGRARILELRHALLREVRIDGAREDDVPCSALRCAALRCAALRRHSRGRRWCGCTRVLTGGANDRYVRQCDHSEHYRLRC
jgi:hypothetical protein